MSSTKYVVAVLLGASLVAPATAQADPEPATPTAAAPPAAPAAADEVLRNVTYIARVDGVARHAKVSYLAEGDQTLTADPTMLPGRTFQVNSVLPESKQATMSVSIDLPYSANLHCKILVDGNIVAQADDFIAPRLTRPVDDPTYGTLSCQAPVGGVAPTPPTPAAETPPAA